jgi:hypothetical protein
MEPNVTPDLSKYLRALAMKELKNRELFVLILSALPEVAERAGSTEEKVRVLEESSQRILLALEALGTALQQELDRLKTLLTDAAHRER